MGCRDDTPLACCTLAVVGTPAASVAVVHRHGNSVSCRRIAGGGYLVACRSVDAKEAPVRKGVVRGRVLTSGWRVDPLSEGCRTRLTFVAQVDIGGWYVGRWQDPLCMLTPLMLQSVQCPPPHPPLAPLRDRLIPHNSNLPCPYPPLFSSG